MTAINVVLMWHMHQPEYRDLASGEFRLPWTYLHAIKDYSDMAAHLERYDGARAVVNFAPVLLEQLEIYGRGIRESLDSGAAIPDRLLNCLVSDECFLSDPENRLWLIRSCLKANEHRLIKRYPVYDELAHIASQLSSEDSVNYLYRQYFIDLVMWYHLAWMGETIKRENAVVRRLIDKGRQFSEQDRRDLLTVIGDIVNDIAPRYRRLADAGKVELSMSPYAHPMLPLLIDFHSAREALPESPLPESSGYPEGEARCHWHIEEGLRVFERSFGRRPVGCWPSEGGVSDAAMKMLSQHGFQWAATGENVLNHSLPAEAGNENTRHRAFRVDGSDTRLFFRDDGLSDLIGFTYSGWHADDAVGDLIHHIHTIRGQCQNPGQHVVSIILDGENAWEYYPENGYYFLDGLYRRLAEDEQIRLTTFEQCVKCCKTPTQLNHVVAGSWVYGNFSTWIGDADKNRAWDLLCQAKTAVDAVLTGELPDERRRKIIEQLAVCEGSDWFWWFGDYNPSTSVRDFDELFRLNLGNLYRLAGLTPPDALSRPVSAGSSDSTVEAGGAMRRGG